jgi:hypothetical protein
MGKPKRKNSFLAGKPVAILPRKLMIIFDAN